MLNSCIVIPARLSSSRLPRKAMLNIGSKPMIAHTWQRAIEANIGPVWVATGDQEIAQCIKERGGQTVITPIDLPSGTDRVAHAVNLIDPEHKFDIVINLQGDMPNVDLDFLSPLLGSMSAETQDTYTVATPVYRISAEMAQTPSVVKAACAIDPVSKQGPALYFSRCPVPYQGQSDLPTYYAHIGIYIFRRQILEKLTQSTASILEQKESLEQLRWLEHGYRILAFEVSSSPLSVDTADDLENARLVMKG